MTQRVLPRQPKERVARLALRIEDAEELAAVGECAVADRDELEARASLGYRPPGKHLSPPRFSLLQPRVHACDPVEARAEDSA